MIQSIFGSKTVAGVLSALNKTLEDLKVVEQSNEAEATRQAQIVLEANAAHDAAIKEAALARAVASNLANLVTPMISEVSLQDLKEACA